MQVIYVVYAKFCRVVGVSPCGRRLKGHGRCGGLRLPTPVAECAECRLKSACCAGVVSCLWVGVVCRGE